jgi:hypothetical protein
MARRHKTTVYLDEPVLRAVKRVARERGTSEALVIREALATYVRKEPQRLPRFVGMVKDGPPDLAEKVDEYLAQGFGRDSVPDLGHRRARRPSR